METGPFLLSVARPHVANQGDHATPFSTKTFDVSAMLIAMSSDEHMHAYARAMARVPPTLCMKENHMRSAVVSPSDAAALARFAMCWTVSLASCGCAASLLAIRTANCSDEKGREEHAA